MSFRNTFLIAHSAMEDSGLSDIHLLLLKDTAVLCGEGHSDLISGRIGLRADVEIVQSDLPLLGAVIQHKAVEAQTQTADLSCLCKGRIRLRASCRQSCDLRSGIEVKAECHIFSVRDKILPQQHIPIIFPQIVTAFVIPQAEEGILSRTGLQILHLQTDLHGLGIGRVVIQGIKGRGKGLDIDRPITTALVADNRRQRSLCLIHHRCKVGACTQIRIVLGDLPAVATVKIYLTVLAVSLIALSVCIGIGEAEIQLL